MSDLDLPRFLPEGLAGLSPYDPPTGDCPVRLDANESPYPPDPRVQRELNEALGDVQLNRYPDPASRDLKSAFARKFQCPAQSVMAGNGSDELIGLLVWALRGCPPGSVPLVITPAPTFGMYSIAALAAGYDVLEVPLGPQLEPDFEGMIRAIREQRPNLVFLSNPNNPTGSFFPREQVQAILDSTTGLVVVDEAYGDFSGEESWIPEVPSCANLAVLRTLSKVGAAAIRCGFLVGSRELLREVDKVRFPFNLSRYTQIAGEIVLRNHELFQPRIMDVVRERERLAAELEGLKLKVFPSRANFLLVKCGGREEALWRFLQEGGIMVRFLSSLPVAGDALRITVGTPEENDLLIARARDFPGEGGKDAQR